MVYCHMMSVNLVLQMIFFFLEHNTNNSVIQIDDVSWCVFAGARKGEGERTSIFLDSQTNGGWIL